MMERREMEQAKLKPYPIALTQLAGVRCVVVGGGEVALRKVRALLESGAHVCVVSPTLHPELEAWHAAERIEYRARPYEHGDLAGAFLVIAATDRREVNAAVAEEARQRNMLYNLADDPAGSVFHTLAAVARGDVLLAVTTGGDSPALAAHLRRKLEQTFGAEYGVLAERMGRLRREIGQSLPPATRVRLWRTLATDDVLELVRNNEPAALELYIETLIAELNQP